MPSGFFVLLRTYVRVDNVVVCTGLVCAFTFGMKQDMLPAEGARFSMGSSCQKILVSRDPHTMRLSQHDAGADKRH